MASGNNEEMVATVHSLPSRYALPELVAHGGMADVYRASDERLGRVVAIKVLAERYARQPEFRKRFLREAQTAATLTGEPNVVAIYDVGETTDGIPFIVMEYASDGTVADRLRAGPRDPDEAMRWLAQTAGALDAAHARGIVHRDVKPANLLVASDGAIRVSDFGIARAAGDDTLTAAGTILGSFGYMAPEQARGERTEPATDRYAASKLTAALVPSGVHARQRIAIGRPGDPENDPLTFSIVSGPAHGPSPRRERDVRRRVARARRSR